MKQATFTRAHLAQAEHLGFVGELAQMQLVVGERWVATIGKTIYETDNRRIRNIIVSIVLSIIVGIIVVFAANFFLNLKGKKKN